MNVVKLEKPSFENNKYIKDYLIKRGVDVQKYNINP